MSVLDRAVKAGQPDAKTVAAMVATRLGQVRDSITTGRMSHDQYQYEAGRAAGLGEALRMIEGQGQARRRDT